MFGKLLIMSNKEFSRKTYLNEVVRNLLILAFFNIL